MDTIGYPRLIASGTYNSQIAQKGVKISKTREVTMFEIELPLKSGGRSYINGISRPIAADTLICAKPGQLRHTRMPFLCYYVHIMVKPGIIYDLLTAAADFIKVKDRARYVELLKKAHDHSQTGSAADELIIQSCLLELVYLIHNDSVTQAHNGNSRTDRQLMIEKTLKYIDDNLSGELTLKNVSRAVSLSPIYFHNLFKASTGVTLHEYVERQRIKRAVNLLVSTDMNLTEIAYECGFSSQSYFSYAFKRRMNATPREYVKRTYKKYSL